MPNQESKIRNATIENRSVGIFLLPPLNNDNNNKEEEEEGGTKPDENNDLRVVGITTETTVKIELVTEKWSWWLDQNIILTRSII